MMLNFSLTNSSDDNNNILEKQCRADWPIALCISANVAGLCSTAVWFLVLFPQVIQNFMRKSVKGLSVLWATANFTASLINLFFVYKYGNLPLYTRISAVYMPCLEIVMLCQFLAYGNFLLKHKIIYVMCCCIVLTPIVVTQLVFDIYNEMEWAAITLWSIETIPQILLNMWRRNTDGMSRGMVCFAMLGKTTDFIANYVLQMPLQTVVMIYFSSSTAYINGMQVGYFGVGQLTLAQFWKIKLTRATPIRAAPVELTDGETDDDAPDEMVNAKLPANYWLIIRTIAIALPSLLLVIYAICFLLNTATWLAILGPIGILSIITSAYVITEYYPQYGEWMGKL